MINWLKTIKTKLEIKIDSWLFNDSENYYKCDINAILNWIHEYLDNKETITRVEY